MLLRASLLFALTYRALYRRRVAPLGAPRRADAACGRVCVPVIVAGTVVAPGTRPVPLASGQASPARAGSPLVARLRHPLTVRRHTEVPEAVGRTVSRC